MIIIVKKLFIPLNRIFTFRNEVNRILKYISFEIVLTKSGNNTHCIYGSANTALDFGGNESGLTFITLHIYRIRFRPDIASNLEKMYKRLFDVAYYKRICENAATQAGIQRTFIHLKILSEADEGNCRYVFIILKTHANNRHQSNYQRCCYANVSNIAVRYGGSVYPF